MLNLKLLISKLRKRNYIAVKNHRDKISNPYSVKRIKQTDDDSAKNMDNAHDKNGSKNMVVFIVRRLQQANNRRSSIGDEPPVDINQTFKISEYKSYRQDKAHSFHLFANGQRNKNNEPYPEHGSYKYFKQFNPHAGYCIADDAVSQESTCVYGMNFPKYIL